LADSKTTSNKVSPIGKSSISDSLNSNDKDSSFYESNYSNSSILTNDLSTNLVKETNILINNNNNQGGKTNDLDFTVNLNVSINDKIDSNVNQSNNLNGLLNVVHSINSNSIMSIATIASGEEKKQTVKNVAERAKPRRRQNKKNLNQAKIKTSANLNDINNLTCSNCFNISKTLCACNISKQALKKLYKNVSDFNAVAFFAEPSIEINFSKSKIKSSLFQNPFDETYTKANYIISYERFVNFENIEPSTEKILEVL
jgi:hypothetical protein